MEKDGALFIVGHRSIQKFLQRTNTLELLLTRAFFLKISSSKELIGNHLKLI